MAPPRPELFVPRWVLAPFGLWVPGSFAPTDDLPEVPPELLPEPRPAIVVSQLPSAFDQMQMYVSEGLLDLEESTEAQQLARVQRLPFETTAIVLAKLAMEAEHARGDTDRELKLAEGVYGSTRIWRRLHALVRNRGAHPFAEQHFFALMQLLVFHASEKPVAENLTDREWIRMSRADWDGHRPRRRPACQAARRLARIPSAERRLQPSRAGPGSVRANLRDLLRDAQRPRAPRTSRRRPDRRVATGALPREFALPQSPTEASVS